MNASGGTEVTMSARLVIDLDLCRECGDCKASCSYPYHPVNDGVARLRELAAQELVCRRCERRSCVEACPNEALEERLDGTLRRWNMRCTGCLSCGHACPFGVIVPAALQFQDGVCDACAGRDVREPLCISTCPLGAIKMEDADAGSADVHVLSDRLAVRSKLWQKLEPVQRP